MTRYPEIAGPVNLASPLKTYDPKDSRVVQP